MKSELKITADGSHTLLLKNLNEPYHSVHGAITESMHVFIKNGLLYHGGKTVSVFEAGFGTGLNCLLTIIEAEKRGLSVNYTAAEKYPLSNDLTDALNYPSIIGGNAPEYWDKIHSSPWGGETVIAPFFSLLKTETDLTKPILGNLPRFDVVFFDAFAPDIQPAIWEKEIFTAIYRHCNPGAVISTYSSKGEVRRRLQSSGFCMEKIPGPPGKKEMLRGIKPKLFI